jgi:glutamyl-tRNA synthetase
MPSSVSSSFFFFFFLSFSFFQFHLVLESPPWTKNVKSGSALEKTPHLLRWFTFVDLDDNVQATLKSHKGGAAGANKDHGQAKDQASYEIDLPGAVKGKVVTRFPPEPSGYLHIGHAKAALLNEFFARKFEGKLIVRFDDTNPSKEKEEYEHAIMEDLETLQIKADVITHTSDYFEDLLKLADQLIKEGNAYADNTPQEQMRKERMDGIASKNRNLSVEENLRLFEEMKKATEVVRISMLIRSHEQILIFYFYFYFYYYFFFLTPG